MFTAIVSKIGPDKDRAGLNHPGKGTMAFARRDCEPFLQGRFATLKGMQVRYDLEEGADGRMHIKNVRRV